MVHVLIEVSGGVVSNVLSEGGEEVTIWLRDYDDLRERGVSVEEAEQVLPVVYDGFGDEVPPASFTKRPLARVEKAPAEMRVEEAPSSSSTAHFELVD